MFDPEELAEWKQAYREQWEEENPELHERNSYKKKLKQATEDVYFVYKRIQTRMFTFTKTRYPISTVKKWLGCDAIFLKEFMDKYEIDGPDNIDHIFPCNFFKLEDPSHLFICNHFTNIRLMDEAENKSRKDTFTEEDKEMYLARLKKFKPEYLDVINEILAVKEI